MADIDEKHDTTGLKEAEPTEAAIASTNHEPKEAEEKVATSDAPVAAESATEGGDEKEAPPTADAVKDSKKSRKSNAQASAKKDDDDSEQSFAAGDSVVVKIQGYPWWPAIVVTEEHFPAAALAARPSTKPRKDGSTNTFYPVQFLGSPEYYWSRSRDIKPLPTADIKAWIESGKKSVSKGLKAAYQQALTSPTLQSLLKAKQDAEAAIVDDDEEMVDAEEAEEAEAESEGTELDDEGKPIKKSKSKKKTASKTPKKAPSKTPTKKRKTEDADSDAAAAAAASASASASAKRSKGTARARRVSSPPPQPELSPEEEAKFQHEQKVKTVMFIRHKLQKCLLGHECVTEKLPEVPGYLERLEKVGVDVEVCRETKILKVLARINKLEEIPQDDDLKIRQNANALLDKWRDIIELLKKKDEEDTQTRAAPQSPMLEPTADAKKPSEANENDKKVPAATNGHAEGVANGKSEETAATKTAETAEEAPQTE